MRYPKLSSEEHEDLWTYSRAHGLSRRHFVHLFTLGGAGAVLAACETPPSPDQAASAEALPWVKDPSPFVRRSLNLETRLENLNGFITPNEQFFVRNHAATPTLDASTYRLQVEGDAIERPLTLSLADLHQMPSHTVVAYLECGGNWRSFAASVLEQTAKGGQWATGAVGCAEWTGVSLRTVLEQAGLRPNALDINLIGLDEGNFERPVPLAKALDADTILAYAMNGAPLPPDHGFPLRAVVPGWVGSNSIKWLGRVVVSSEKVWVKANTSSYVLIGPEWPADQYVPAQGAPVTEQSVKSALALPRPASLSAGTHRLRGFAHGPNPIAQVEWSADGGASWKEARLLEPIMRYAWVRFEIEWEATTGSHTLLTRATDTEGNSQANPTPYNEKGYLLNMPLPHPITVA